MTNEQISDTFSLLSKLMDIHGENSFKTKSYASAAFNIEKLDVELSETSKEKIASLKGIGTSTSQKINEILETGKLKLLEDLINTTPAGIIEMLNLKGLGPKKISTIWKEMEIESINELLYASNENRLKLYKGFGEKTQQAVIDTIQFYLKSKDVFLYASVENLAYQIENLLQNIFGKSEVRITGEFLRQLPVINKLEYCILKTEEEIRNGLKNIEDFSFQNSENKKLYYDSSSGVKIILHSADKQNFISTIVQNSSSETFVQSILKDNKSIGFNSEEEYFTNLGLPHIPAYMREDNFAETDIEIAKNYQPITEKDIKGLVHCHSSWSDGTPSIEQLAEEAKAKGMEYMLITDHSKTAFYAEGLYEDRVAKQHLQIDELNSKLTNFKIFKGIESDILYDGNLDYANDVLSSFDCIIASVHSVLKMNEEKAMMRLIKAIENPYTSILGHMTGRILLGRPGYPVDHKKIIDACAANDVVIELNANPSRLDIDWSFIKYALQKNVLISINPDAHSIKGIGDIKYGTLVAQKALLPAEKNLTSFSLQQFEEFIKKQKAKRN